MINKTKVFWSAATAVWVGLALYGVFFERDGAFPTIWWAFGYAGLAAFWAGVVGFIAVALAIFFEHLPALFSDAINLVRTVGKWFLN